MTAISPDATTDHIRVLIVAENASAKFGGESILPLHYFRHLRRRGVETWMIAHDRTRTELSELIPEELHRVEFLDDNWLDILASRMARILPHRVNRVTLAYVARLGAMLRARRLARRMISELEIDVLHQPIPVSPKEPSVFFGMGVPVLIGPMNGGMDYPQAFAKQLENPRIAAVYNALRSTSDVMNRLIPGKLQATVLLVANDRTRRALPKGVQGEVVLLVENGVDLSIFQSTFDDRGSPAHPDHVRFLFMGRLVDWKSVDLLLRAFQEVVPKVAATLEIVGDGSIRSELESLTAELGLEDSVQFSGWVPQSDCARKLRESDVLVLPSLYECGGAVVLEAMACGLPVIATDWGGPADYLDETCGVLIPPDSRERFISGLTEAMIRLAQSAELRSAMGRAGRERVERDFDWETKTARMLDIYKRAMDTARARGLAIPPAN
jgi:glycosyltransferase involved in cell wall biosynthesis